MVGLEALASCMAGEIPSLVMTHIIYSGGLTLGSRPLCLLCSPWVEIGTRRRFLRRWRRGCKLLLRHPAGTVMLCAKVLWLHIILTGIVAKRNYARSRRTER